ncbi:MAG: ABC transporter substrate-binding protein [Betaproteobacteria bacterium]|jgi:branched-chain amino acid transport system substrate-binding protein|nr:ABC transporter substrate-binding protein [Betaproteobacteria bacterium]MBK7458118.1 ABC transporter substrate-binding protein [Betaproteobacteria bacterium]MBK8107403.1 ABC transporter substrate-binding protein [Betaproteobacteria bacterium]
MNKHSLFGRRVVAATLAVVGATALAQDIKLGFNGDLSASPSAQSGAAGVIGIQAAIEDINAAGGVLGRKLTLVIRDDQSQPPKSIQNMTELIDSEKVAAVFGPTNSGNAMAWKHIPNQKKVVSMGMIGGATDITKPMSPEADNYMFRVSIVDREQVVGLMAYAKKAGARKLGLIAETTGYGQGGLKDMVEIAKLQGLEVAVAERMAVADTDVTSQLNKMKAAEVDTLVIWAQGTPTGQVMRSMEKVNYFPKVLSSWAADNITFYDAAGKALAEKPIFMRTMVDAVTPKQKALFERIKGQLAAPSAFTFVVHGYDATQILAAALRQAGTASDGVKIREALESLAAPIDGVKKTYVKPFSKSHHEALTAADFAFVKWADGKLVQVNDAVTAALSAADFKR